MNICLLFKKNQSNKWTYRLRMDGYTDFDWLWCKCAVSCLHFAWLLRFLGFGTSLKKLMQLCFGKNINYLSLICLHPIVIFLMI